MTHDPIIAKLINLFNTQGLDELKNRYYFGDPIQVNPAELPAVFITKDNTRIKSASNAQDSHRINLNINVVYNLKDVMSQSLETITGYDKLYDILEGRNDDCTLKSNSLAGILRESQDLASNMFIDLESDLSIDYGIRNQMRGPNLITVEGIIKTQIIFDQLV